MNPPLPLRLPNDQPKADQGAGDTARLGPVIEVLTTHLSQFLCNRTAMPPPRIGVFGGLGQGKTSALNGLRKKLVGNGAIKPCRIRVFNASFYDEKVLAQEFDRLAASWGLASHFKSGLFWSLLLFLAVSIGYWLIFGLTSLFSDTLPKLPGGNLESGLYVEGWILLASTFAASTKTLIGDWLTPAYRFWRRDMERHLNLGGQFWLSPLFTPYVLLVDDLDRATPIQQRAVLRALYKHSEALRMAVVVCMDETGLFAAGDLPDSPAALLRKVIHVECRLPMRVREDHLRLIDTLLDEYIELNLSDSGSPWCALLNHPLIRADLARVFSLLPEFGPRRCKRLLNDWLLHLQQLSVFCGQGLPCIEDCAALLRLQGIFDLAPALRDGGETLLSTLEANSEHAFKALATFCFADEKQQQQKALLMDFLRKTRHLQPVNGVWRTLGAFMISDQKKDVAPNEGLDSADQWHQVCLGYSATAWGYLKLNLPTNLLDAAKQGHSQTLKDTLLTTWRWPAAECILAASKDAQSRLLIYASRLNELPDLSGDPADKDFARLQHFLLLRAWSADESAINHMADYELQELLKRIKQSGEDFHHLAFRIPPLRLAFGQRLSMLNEWLSKERLQGISNLLPVLRQWLVIDEPRSCDFPTDDLSQTLRLKTWDHGLLNAVWPPLCFSDNADRFILRLDWHLQWATRLMQQDMALNKILLDAGELVEKKDILQKAQTEQKEIPLARIFIMATRKPDSGLTDINTLRAIKGIERILQWAIKTLEPEYQNDHLLWQNALWVACSLHHEDLIKILLNDRAIRDVGLIDALIALPDNRLWHETVTSPLTLGKLLSNANQLHRQKLTRILLQRPDYNACRKSMELPLIDLGI